MPRTTIAYQTVSEAVATDTFYKHCGTRRYCSSYFIHRDFPYFPELISKSPSADLLYVVKVYTCGSSYVMCYKVCMLIVHSCQNHRYDEHSI